MSEDPLTRIGTVEFPAAVMLGGYWMDDSKLEEAREAARDTSLIRSVWRVLQMKLWSELASPYYCNRARAPDSCAWPSSDCGSLPIQGRIEGTCMAELASAEDPDAHLAAIKERLN